MTKQEALKELESWDHLVVSSKAATEVCAPFGVKPPEETHYPDAYRFDNEGKTVRDVKGIAAHILAVHLCKELEIRYVSQSGKGSQLRMCVKALSENI
jgi:hypothetical protein